MDVTAQEELKAHLMSTDEHFRELVNQHHEYDHKLQELEAKHALTDEDRIEEVRLKKLKLRLKDEMVEIINRARPQHV
ncbi:MAG TPA: DUF465 domain-containing protein [Bryobacteraceae bacterium]|nr:DUF465 domain-containing protein [Bryobacteraceae bacterium]